MNFPFKPINHSPHSIIPIIVLLLLASLVACQSSKTPSSSAKNNAEKAGNLENRLTLNNATLEQSNAKGELLWKIQVETAVYSLDRKLAYLTKVKGNIFQNGQIVLKVSADNGEVQRDGEDIYLKNNIIAVDPRNKAVIRSDEVEWRPQQATLIVRKNLRGIHPQLEVSAKEGKYHTQQQQLELNGSILAIAKDPRLQLTTDYLLWQIPQQKVSSDRPLKMVRYQDKTVTDQITANRVQVLLNVKQAILEQNIEFKSLDPPVQVASNQIIWQYKDRQARSEMPIKLVHHGNGITLTGNRGQANLGNDLAHLSGGVQGTNSRTQAKLYANEMIWQMAAQTIEAMGNVIYEQKNPKFNVTGDKAVGTLNNNNIVVTNSNRQERVVTEIFPNK